MVCLHDGEKILNVHLFVSTEYIHVMDRHMDRYRMTA